MNIVVDAEKEVLERYAEASTRFEPELCCAVQYDPKFLAAIPEEVIEKDYGCGDPSQFIREGDVVLDLGSGTGKICFIAAQIVGPNGHVIGVDFNPAMLELARRHQPTVAANIGHDNVTFKYGKIQDLKTDYDLLSEWVNGHPVTDAATLAAFESRRTELARTNPLIGDTTIDVIVSNCVLNLVRADDKPSLFAEMFRVLKPGGRIAISDIVSDQIVPEPLRNDPDLWSGCISGAFQETEFLSAFEAAGFFGIEIAERDAEPWRVVEGIEFRSVTVTAWKPRAAKTDDGQHEVIYRGPWRSVTDETGLRLDRGEAVPVSLAAYQRLTDAPYAGQIIAKDGGVKENKAKSCC